MFPPRPSSLAHLTDDEAARSLSRRFGDIAAAAKDLGVDRTDLRKLTWSNPAILDAAHERQAMFLDRVWDEATAGLTSKSARVRERAVDRLCAHPRMLGSPFASGLSVFARAPRARGPRPGDRGKAAAEEARLELERQAAAEQSFEQERERALEQERVEPRPPAPAPAMSFWPAHIHRPTRGRRC
jgi:hypothetical protein